MEKSYIAIDLKAFYGSVECVERGLDPLTTNLVVADESRTQKTICLSVTPSLKKYGLSGRARLFEVIQKVKAANAKRLNYADGRVLVVHHIMILNSIKTRILKFRILSHLREWRIM